MLPLLRVQGPQEAQLPSLGSLLLQLDLVAPIRPPLRAQDLQVPVVQLRLLFEGAPLHLDSTPIRLLVGA